MPVLESYARFPVGTNGDEVGDALGAGGVSGLIEPAGVPPPFWVTGGAEKASGSVVFCVALATALCAGVCVGATGALVAVLGAGLVAAPAVDGAGASGIVAAPAGAETGDTGAGAFFAGAVGSTVGGLARVVVWSVYAIIESSRDAHEITP